MQIYFVRHGQAEPRESWRGNDVDRPLTDCGRSLIAEEGVVLQRSGVTPDAILTSPLLRAKQTGGILADCLNVGDRLSVDKRLGPGFGPEQLLKILRDHSKAQVLVLVGQEPDLTETITKLVGRSRIVLKRGGMAQVEITDARAPKGRLLGLLSPTVFADRPEQC
jgi:phosphohistidine phosphatase